MNNLKILVCHPNQIPEVAEVVLDAEAIKTLVGGWFGAVRVGTCTIMYFNQTPEGLQFNKQIGNQSVYGTFILSGWDGEETDLTEHQISYWTTRLAQSQAQPDA